jgi:hypothetical protein
MNSFQEHIGKETTKRKYTPAQKWAEAVRLRQMAWNLKIVSVKHAHPEWSDEQVYNIVKEIFLYATT